MNKYDRERIDMITVMVMYITKLPAKRISPYMRKTKTYSNILRGDEITLYDSYAANLMDMAGEWKEKEKVPPVLRNITAEQVNESNTWLRDKEIRDAAHARLLLSRRQKSVQLLKLRKNLSANGFSTVVTLGRKPKVSGAFKVKEPILGYGRRKGRKEPSLTKQLPIE